MPALATLIDQKTSTISRLTGGLLNPMPGVVLINLGENGAPALADVTNALVKLRHRVRPATKIIVMVPVAGTARLQVTQGFNSYTKATADANAFLVDLGAITYPTGDGQHPTALGHEMIYQDALPFFDPIIVTLGVQYQAGNTVQLTWSSGVLLMAPNLAGPWLTNATATSPFTISPTAPQMYYRIQVQ